MKSPTAAVDRAQREHQRNAKRLRDKTAAEGKRAAKMPRILRRVRGYSGGASRNAGSWNQAGKTVSLLFKKHRGSTSGDSYSLKDKTAQHVGTSMLGQTSEQRLAEFKLDFQRHPMVAPENLVVHVSLSRPEGHELTLQQWGDVAKAWLKNIGAEGCNFTIARHPGKHDHVHIVYSRSKPDGTLISDSNDFYKGRAAAREAARSLGIEVPDFAPKPAQAPTDRAVSAHRRADRRGTKRAWVDPNIIHRVLSKSRNFEDFQQNLKTAGIDCKLSTSSTGQPTGVLFRSEGSAEFLAGSTLDRSLSLPKIRQQFNSAAASGISPPSLRAPMPGPGMRHAPPQIQAPRQRGG